MMPALLWVVGGNNLSKGKATINLWLLAFFLFLDRLSFFKLGKERKQYVGDLACLHLSHA